MIVVFRGPRWPPGFDSGGLLCCHDEPAGTAEAKVRGLWRNAHRPGAIRPGLRRLAPVDLAGALRRRTDELCGRAGQAGHGHPLPRSAVQRCVRAPAPPAHPGRERPAGSGHRVVPGHLDRGGQSRCRRRRELHLPLQRHGELRLADRRPARAGGDGLAAHRLAVLRGQSGRGGVAGLDAHGERWRLLRHQRAADGDHRSGQVLGEGSALAAGARAATRRRQGE